MPPRQDVLASEGVLGGTSYEAVPAGRAEEVIRRRKRRARRLVGYRLVGVGVLTVIVTAVVFRFARDLTISGGTGLAVLLVGGALQFRALDQGVPEVVAEGVPPREVRAEYGVEPAEGEVVAED